MLAVCAALARAYGSPRHGNPEDPFEDLIYILLSNRTAPATAVRVYRKLKETYPTGDAILAARPEALARLLAPAGLANKRASHLRAIATRLRADFGRIDLDALAGWPDERAEAYLCSLPGVSLKVAKCVLMYGLGRRVLPVDVHVHRVASRLGWIAHRRADQSHASLEALVPPAQRFGFHVDALAHGRAVCVAGLPRCGRCVVRQWCHYFRAGGPARAED